MQISSKSRQFSIKRNINVLFVSVLVYVVVNLKAIHNCGESVVRRRYTLLSKMQSYFPMQNLLKMLPSTSSVVI